MSGNHPRWISLLSAAALVWMAWPAVADVVTLRNGRKIEGAVVSETAAEVVVQTSVGQVRVSRREISSVVRTNREAEEVQADRFRSQGNFSAAVDALERLEARAKAAKNAATLERAQTSLARARAELASAVERELSVKLAQARQASTAGDLARALSLGQTARATITGKEAQSATDRFLAEVHLRRAQQAADRQDSISRLRELTEAVRLDPGFYPAQLALGEILLEDTSQEARGLQLIEKALKDGNRSISDRDRARYHYIIAERYYRKRQYQDAATNFVAVLGVKDAPKELGNALDRAVECYVNLGETSMASGAERTLEGLSEALNLNPRNTKALFLMGRILYQTGNFKEAVDNLKKLLELDSNYYQANQMLAKAHQALNNFDEALAAIDRELKINSNNYEALCDRSELRLLVADYAGARTDIELAKKQQADGIRAFLIEAQLNIIDEKFDEAQTSLNSLMARATTAKDKLEPYLQMGRVLARKKQADDARKWFQTVGDFLLNEAKAVGTTTSLPLRFRNILAEVNVELGKLNLEQDNPRSAEANFREALATVEDFPTALIGIGDVWRRLGDEAAAQQEKDNLYREAERFYKKALAINPRDADSTLKLAILYHRFMKDTRRAVVEYRRYIELGGRDRATAQQGLDEIGAEAPSSSDVGTTATAAADGYTTPSANAAETTAPVSTAPVGTPGS
jgi:tetratricopeptide (TPR) repeat protein